MTDTDRERLARQHRPWPVVVRSLHEEPLDELSDSMTAEERVALVWTLTARMWELMGQPLPAYARSAIPLRVLRGQ